MAYRRDDTGTSFLIGLLFYGWIGYWYGGWKGVEIAVLLMLIFLWWKACHVPRREKRDEKRREMEPCQHGVPGARYNRQLCPNCVEEVERQRIEDQRRRDEDNRRKEDERRRRYQDWLAEIRLPEFLKTVDPEKFEQLICRLFSQMGYRVEATPYVGDNGSDGYLYKDGRKTVLQCKRVKGAVGEPILRDLYGTMHATQSQSAMVVTTGTVSKQARKWIGEKPIRIIELDELQKLLRTYFPESEVVPSSFTVSGWLETCPRCGKQLRIVNGRHGNFIGCVGYDDIPRCEYTRRVSDR